MLSAYLASKETIDISLMLSQSSFGDLSSGPSQDNSASRQTALMEAPPTKRRRTSRETFICEQLDLLELDLDKSMAAITATQSPLAVLRTIEWAKNSRFAPR